mmetsp:Transcript_8987/g.19959  ORF Transcript_8987/g.19959 Transcript_8987/m.19959 type:complete len:173 (+) Transcript_8987:1211-1729(+)
MLSAISSLLPSWNSLKTLDLSHNSLGTVPLQRFFVDMSHALPGVENLNLAGNNLGVENSANLAALVEQLGGQLKYLGVSKNLLGDSGASMLAKALRRAANLKKLDVRFNRISTLGIELIMDSLADLPNMQVLDISNTGWAFGTSSSAAPKQQIFAYAKEHIPWILLNWDESE